VTCRWCDVPFLCHAACETQRWCNATTSVTQVRRGLIDGNNSPSGDAVMFECGGRDHAFVPHTQHPLMALGVPIVPPHVNLADSRHPLCRLMLCPLPTRVVPPHRTRCAASQHSLCRPTTPRCVAGVVAHLRTTLQAYWYGLECRANVTQYRTKVHERISNSTKLRTRAQTLQVVTPHPSWLRGKLPCGPTNASFTLPVAPCQSLFDSVLSSH
jgi:hypothetical protein